MSEQHLLSIDQFCEKYAISRASFYDLELERRRFISKDTDQKWEEFIREHNV